MLPVDELIPFSYIKNAKAKTKTKTGKKKATNETKTKINDLQKKKKKAGLKPICWSSSHEVCANE